MYYFYTYGFLDDDIDKQKIILEACLGFSLFEKDSSYYNLAFSATNKEDESFLLQENYDGEGFVEENHKDFPVIFDVTVKSLKKGQTLKEKILIQEGATLIKHSTSS